MDLWMCLTIWTTLLARSTLVGRVRRYYGMEAFVLVDFVMICALPTLMLQISFYPADNATYAPSDRFVGYLFGSPVNIYSHSYLCFGLTMAQMRLQVLITCSKSSLQGILDRQLYEHNRDLQSMCSGRLQRHRRSRGPVRGTSLRFSVYFDT